MSEPSSESSRISRYFNLFVFVTVVAPIILLSIFIEFRVKSIESSMGTLEQSLNYQVPGHRDDSRKEIDALPWYPVHGQRLYVPAYSHVYHQKGDPYLLTVTLSVRNTDIDDEIAITSVRYFDTGGNQIKSMLNKPLKLRPMAATEFVIERNDKSGGSGASFLVEWNAGKKVSPPVVETVMIDTSSTQGLSFIASAVVLEDTYPSENSSTSDSD